MVITPFSPSIPTNMSVTSNSYWPQCVACVMQWYILSRWLEKLLPRFLPVPWTLQNLPRVWQKVLLSRPVPYNSFRQQSLILQVILNSPLIRLRLLMIRQSSMLLKQKTAVLKWKPWLMLWHVLMKLLRRLEILFLKSKILLPRPTYFLWMLLSRLQEPAKQDVDSPLLLTRFVSLQSRQPNLL